MDRLAQQIEKKPNRRPYSVPAIMHRTCLLQVKARSMHLRRRESPSLVFELFDLLRARFVESARANKLNGPLQFEFVKPRPVRFANIHDDVRALCKLGSIHQLVANGAGHVPNSLLDFQRLIERRGHAGCECLFLPIRANLLQSVHVNPNPFAAAAFEQIGGPDGYLI
jgi:hypothetical protein